jgi:hypothetical protein
MHGVRAVDRALGDALKARPAGVYPRDERVLDAIPVGACTPRDVHVFNAGFARETSSIRALGAELTPRRLKLEVELCRFALIGNQIPSDCGQPCAGVVGHVLALELAR